MHASKGITPRRLPVNECMCCMRCMFGCCMLPRMLVVFPRLALSSTRGNPISGSTPSSCMTHSHPLPFAPVSLWATGSSECCRGIIYVSLPWHPFRLSHDDKCFMILLMSTFNKNCIKLAHVIRIMLITSRMFKVVVCIKLLSAHQDLHKVLFDVSGLI